MRHILLSLLLVFAIVISTCVWAQRGGGSRSSGTTHSSELDPGAVYGVGAIAPLPTQGTSNLHHAEDEERVEFKSETVLVQVPVVVTDKSGAHLHHLTQQDFQIFENGKEQKITSLDEVTAANSPLPPIPAKPGEFTNLTADTTQAHTISIIAIDSVNTPYLDQAYGREQLIKYLSQNLDPGQALALVMIGNKGVRVVHGLTSDPAQLVAAIKKVGGEIPAMQGLDTEAQVAALGRGSLTTATAAMNPQAPEVGASDSVALINIVGALNDFVLKGDAVIADYQQSRAIDITLRAFLNIAAYVSGIPGRKALIWATGSFPFTIDKPSTVPGGDLSLLYERTMKALNDSQVSIYPVDIRGLVNYMPTADAKYSGGHYGPQAMNAAVGRSLLQTSTIDSLKDFAAMTGGRAFYNTNDLVGSLHKVAEDDSSYYLLGYYLDTHNNKPGWRQLKVKVRKPDVEVRARNGFFVTNATMNPGLTRALDENFALNSPFDATSVPIILRWLGTTADGDKRKVNFQIAVPSGGVMIDEVAQNRFSIDLAAVVTDNKGANAGKFEQPLQGNIKPESMAIVKAQGISYHNLIELSPGQYTVRMMVRDNLSGKIGSVSAPLTVN